MLHWCFSALTLGTVAPGAGHKGRLLSCMYCLWCPRCLSASAQRHLEGRCRTVLLATAYLANDADTSAVAATLPAALPPPAAAGGKQTTIKREEVA